MHYKTVLHNTAQPAEKTAPVQEDIAVLKLPKLIFSDKDGDRLYEEVGVVSIQMELQSKMLGDKEWHGCGCFVLEKL